MTKRKYKKVCIVLSIVVIGMGYLLIMPDLYNKIHKHITYYAVKHNTPDWISVYYKP